MLPYAAAVFLSGFLLFGIQPAIAKVILPLYGGSAAVWTTCLLFFQVVLLLGYSYAHLLAKLPQPKLQVAAHAAVLAASVLVLRATAAGDWTDPQSGSPVLSILALLVASAGLPCFALSSTGPLLQTWFGRAYGRAVPYRLFAVSNFACLAGLFAYPVIFERLMTTRAYLRWWSAGYAAFALASVAAGFVTLRTAQGEHEKAKPELKAPMRTGAAQWILWLVLPACTSALLLSVTNHLCQEVAPVPLLWVIPFGAYLLSFVLTFGSDHSYKPAYRVLLTPSLAVMALFYTKAGAVAPLLVAGPVYTAALFVCCMYCHGELARRKPDVRRLTSFYLTVSLGGALGGIFVGLIAPVLYRDYAELPVSVAACGILAIAIERGKSGGRSIALAVTGIAATIVLFAPVSRLVGPGVTRFRNFYGAFRLSDTETSGGRLRKLYSGNTLHGSEFLSPEQRAWPTAYYSPFSGVGTVLRSGGPPRRVGVVGLGAGTLAAYARPGDLYDFYEINPLVVKLAETNFRFLKDCRGQCDVVLGDARQSLERESPQHFDVLVLDAFSGDSVPVHLLTQEAFRLYFRHLERGGVLAVHVSNRHLNLAPVVASACEPLGKRVSIVRSGSDEVRGIEVAVWAVVTDGAGRQASGFRPWTDDYSSLLSILSW